MLWQDYTLISAFRLPVVTEIAWVSYFSSRNYEHLSPASMRMFIMSFSLLVTSL